MPVIDRALTIGAGQSFTFVNEAYVLTTTQGFAPPVLTNRGALIFRNPEARTAGIVVDYSYSPSYPYEYARGRFHNAETGILIVENLHEHITGTAEGITSNYVNGIDVINDGIISVYSEWGYAFGVTTLMDERFVFENRGAILVDGVISYGVGATYAASFYNAGLIHAEGVIGALAVSAWSPSFVNDGVISAHASQGQAYGVMLLRDARGVFHNNGVIDAHFAIVTPDVYYLRNGQTPPSNQNIVFNTGEIRGHVFLGLSDDEFHNDGLVVGDLNLGEGDDVYIGTGLVDGRLRGAEGDDILIGGNLGDWLEGGEGDDLVDAGDGDDHVVAGRGADVMDGGAGYDVIDYSLSTSRIVADLAAGTVQNGLQDRIRNFEAIIGSSYADFIVGSDRADLLEGASGDDTLSGGDGDDQLIGDRGADVLTGGRGADAFIFSAGDGADTIVDFDASQGDRIQVHGYSGYLELRNEGDDVRIVLSATDSILVRGASAGSLAGGLSFSAAPLPPPPPDISPSPFSMVVTDVAVVGTGERLLFSDGPGVLMSSIGRGETSLFNDGLISLSRHAADNASYVSAIYAESNPSPNVRSWISNQSNGVIEAIGTGMVQSHAIASEQSGWMPWVFNAGVIRATSETRSSAITSPAWCMIINTGLIEVSASVAVGLQIQGGGGLWNSGDIIVSGSNNSLSFAFDTLGVWISTPDQEFVNSGRIIASHQDGIGSARAIGLLFDTYSGVHEFFNSGLIQGDYAVMQQRASSGEAFDTNIFYNTGELNGQVLFLTSMDKLYNQGTVNGKVELGDGADLYDGRGGFQTGGVFGDDGDDILLGGSGQETLDGGSGDDILFGGGGGDTLTGGAGHDLFRFGIGSGGDVITDFTPGGAEDVIEVEGYASYLRIEQIGADARVVFSESDFIVLKNVQASAVTAADFVYRAETTSTTAPVHPTAPVAPTVPTAPAPRERDFALTGGDGSDNLVGGALADSLFGRAGNDILSGGLGNDLLYGGDGNDRLIGGGGDDLLNGGQGADAFVFNADGGFDVILDFDQTEGDRIYLEGFGPFAPSSVSRGQHSINFETLNGVYIVSQNGLSTIFVRTDASASTISNAIVLGSPPTLADTPPVIFNGTAGNDTLTGSIHNDRLNGGEGNDQLSGSLGDDELIGGGGDDYLDGGRGADVMTGGAGNDSYIVDNVGDRVVETSGGGLDTVESWLSFELDAHVENLTLRGVFGLAGRGNADANIITGNQGSNTLEGLGGNDTLFGGAGDDTLNGGDDNDVLIGGAGNDALNGGNGYDIAGYSGVRRAYTASATSVSGNGEGVDTLTGVEDLAFTDGRLTFARDSQAAQVMRLYDAALDRAPDQSGFEALLDVIERGQMTLLQLADEFVNSVEFQARFGALTDRQYVEQLYLFSLDRAGDAGGIQTWVDALAGGMTRARLLVEFSESAEHKDLLQGRLDQGLWVADELTLTIARLYDATYDRLPDQGGLATWRNALGGGMALIDIAQAFASAPEFQARYGSLSNAAFVELMYQLCLDRDADAGGLQTWTSALDGGMSRGEMLMLFSESAEHVALTRSAFLGGVPCIDVAPPAGPEVSPLIDADKHADHTGPLVLPGIDDGAKHEDATAPQVLPGADDAGPALRPLPGLIARGHEAVELSADPDDVSDSPAPDVSPLEPVAKVADAGPLVLPGLAGDGFLLSKADLAALDETGPQVLPAEAIDAGLSLDPVADALQIDGHRAVIAPDGDPLHIGPDPDTPFGHDGEHHHWG